MDLQQQKEFIRIYKQYQDTSKDTIKANLKSYMNESDLLNIQIAERTEIALQTIYYIRKNNSNNYKPDFITTLIICDLLRISITEVMQSIPGLKILKPITTKWDMTAKQEFISNYENMNILELCKKYQLTLRTAQEYNKNFSRDIEK